METNDNKPVKFNPGPKGILAMNGRSKDEQKEYRRQYFEFIREMIAKGFTRDMRLDALITKYGVSHRQAKTYLKEELDDRSTRRNETRVKKSEEMLLRAEYNYRKAIEAGDGKLAREWWKEIANLEGLYAPKQTVNLNRHEVENITTIADTIDVQDLVILESILNKKPKE